MHEEGAAADARGLRFDEPEHRLHRDRGIDRGAAGAQHLETRLHGERVGGGDHAARAPIACRLGFDDGRGGAGRDDVRRPRRRRGAAREDRRQRGDRDRRDGVAPHSAASMSRSIADGSSVGA